MSDFKQKMDQMIYQYLDNKNAIASLKDKQENLLSRMGDLLHREGQYSHTLLVDADTLVTVTDEEQHKRVLNKEELANDMGILKSKVKTPLLLEFVEQGKLTRARYERYHYNDIKQKITVKKRKPKKGKK